MPDSYREPIEEKPELLSALSLSADSAEQEILELEKRLAEKRAALGKGLSAEALAKTEKPLEQIIGQEKPAGSSAVLPPSMPVPTATLAPQVKEKAGELKRYEKTQQLKGLIDIAFQKGISYAVDVAREMDNPFLMDELHDVLVDELRKELIDRGKLEEI